MVVNKRREKFKCRVIMGKGYGGVLTGLWISVYVNPTSYIYRMKTGFSPS